MEAIPGYPSLTYKTENLLMWFRAGIDKTLEQLQLEPITQSLILFYQMIKVLNHR